MLPPTVRRIRFALIALVVAVVAWVGLSYRQPPAATASAEPEPVTANGQPPKTRMTEYVHRQLSSEGRELIVRARDSEGSEQEEVRLREVEITFGYSMKGTLEKGTIVSDEGIYKPTLGTAVFQGHVKLKTADGFTLETESLSYDQKAGSARSEHPVAFRRKDVSGSGRGMLYDQGAGTVQLDADARLRIDDESGVTDITSQRALLHRADQTIRFIGDVYMKKANDELRSEELIVNFNEETNVVQRAEAIGNVHLRAHGAQELGPVDKGSGNGLRELRGKKLDIFFRPDRTMERMEAGPDGELVIHPGPKDPPEIQRLTARLLTFLFDEAGRMVEVQGHKESGFVTEPTVKGRAGTTMACQSFFVQFNPENGDMEIGEFSKEVRFGWPGVEARSQKARFERHRAPGGLLMMRDEPELREAQNGSRLTALAIDIEVASRNVAARQQIKHVIPPRQGRGLIGSDAETVVTSRLFNYETAQAIGRYRGEALMRAGQDELRAEEISVERNGGRLRASGNVVSILTPKNEGATPVKAEARTMMYDEASATGARIDYAGDVVVMRHGDMTTRSPRSIVFLGADKKGFERLEAGEPVIIEQGKRWAKGGWGVYRPDAKTITLTKSVELRDDQGQTMSGERLSFNLDLNTVHVDGAQEVRTETVFRKEVATP